MTSHQHDHEDLHGHDAAASAGSCGGHAPPATALAHAGADDTAECPVMAGVTVIKSHAESVGLYRDHNGQRYWLCCDSCGPLFDADPDRYAAV